MPTTYTLEQGAENMERNDIYQTVTDRIIASLETGVAPWIRPWHDGAVAQRPRNANSKREYSGINVWLLDLTAMANGYQSGEWTTYKGAQKLGGTVRKGEKGTGVVYWQFFDKTDDNGNIVDRIPLLRSYTVFAREQCDNLPPVETVPVVARPVAPIVKEAIDYVGRKLGLPVSLGNSQAYYQPASDVIALPNPTQFVDDAACLSTLWHEAAHATGHPNRLDRLVPAKFGSPDYAKEELCAEIASAFACEIHGINGRLQHVEYVANWIKALRNDKKLIVTAASQARKAVEYLGFGQAVEG